MIALRSLFAVLLALALAACGSTPSAPSLGALPTPSLSGAEQLLRQASESSTEQALLLRLSAADNAVRQGNASLAQRILDQLPHDQLLPAQRIFVATLEAELALARQRPETALRVLQLDEIARLPELPASQQARTLTALALAHEQSGDLFEAVRERITLAPLLSGPEASQNHQQTWALVSRLEPDQLASNTDDLDLNGWLSLAQAVRESGNAQQQNAAIDDWRNQHPYHPAALELPAGLQQLQTLGRQQLEKIALLLPKQGQLASVARALRDGFLAARYQDDDSAPEVHFYDSTGLDDLTAFYRKAEADGIDLVIGPLEKHLVTRLSQQQQLPITTLALNYSERLDQSPGNLFQFGLAAEDEARSAAHKAWADGKRNAAALVPPGEWGERVLGAFRQAWSAQGGELLAAERIAQPVDLVKQVARILQLNEGADNPSRRQDLDFIFLAATPAQARQIKPTLTFQYAGDLPVYATSHLYDGVSDSIQNQDLNDVEFSETPWLLDPEDPLRKSVEAQWPQAAGSLGRLYAMGADAYTLGLRLPQLKALPGTQVEGHSGILSLTPSQRVERKLPWAQFRNGKVERLDAPAF